MSTRARPAEFTAFWLAALTFCALAYFGLWHAISPLVTHLAALWHQLLTALDT